MILLFPVVDALFFLKEKNEKVRSKIASIFSGDQKARLRKARLLLVVVPYSLIIGLIVNAIFNN